jgi:penicillin amidase
VAALSPEARALLERYTDGVNAWLATHGGAWPPEFYLLGYRPEPWTPADSIAWAYLMALQLSGNFRSEIDHVLLDAAVGSDRAADLTPDLNGMGPFTVASVSVVRRLAAAMPPPLGPDRASNEWVASGDRTETGAPILANDPHLGLSTPVLWYLARVVLPDRSIEGATAPGTPLFLLGQNGHVAWGFTTAVADTQDLFVETVDPADPGRYIGPDGPAAFESWTETIPVRGAEPVTVTFRATRHGPVLTDLEDLAPVAEAIGAGKVVALEFAALAGPNTTPEALYRMNRATDWSGFHAALAAWTAPTQNIAFAAADGTIALALPGRIPIRAGNRSGARPVDGTDRAQDWQGFIPFADLPVSVDPDGGTLFNANNTTVGPDFPFPLGGSDEPPYRALRIARMLDEGPLSVARSEAMQADTLALDALDLRPLFGRIRTTTLPQAQALDRLTHWDGRMDRDAAAPLIYMAWLTALTRDLVGDELGALYDDLGRISPEAVLRIIRDKPIWCDDVGTAETEDCDALLSRAFAESIDLLSTRRGADVDAWRWGDEHKAPLTNQVWSRIPVLADLFWPAVETDGGAYTLNRADGLPGTGPLLFPDTHAAGYRAIYDLADPAASRFMVATGQSGHPLSPHYRDLTPLWRDNRYIGLTGTEAELKAQGAPLLTMTPGP